MGRVSSTSTRLSGRPRNRASLLGKTKRIGGTTEMAEYIAIPKLGMSMVDATLVEWKVKEGTRVEKGDVVLMIETEKTQWEVEASAPGFVHIMVEEDIKAPVGRVVGLITETKEDLEAAQKEPAKEIFTTVAEPAEALPVE
ncbi:MAG: biotin/lipoyl-binding protein, partial [Dehalococcoidia bacterium]